MSQWLHPSVFKVDRSTSIIGVNWGNSIWDITCHWYRSCSISFVLLNYDLRLELKLDPKVYTSIWVKQWKRSQTGSELYSQTSIHLCQLRQILNISSLLWSTDGLHVFDMAFGVHAFCPKLKWCERELSCCLYKPQTDEVVFFSVPYGIQRTIY